MTVFKARRIPEACRALGIGKSTLYKLSSEGKIKLVRIAGRTVVPESEIDRLASGRPAIPFTPLGLGHADALRSVAGTSPKTPVPHLVPRFDADWGVQGRRTADIKSGKC